MAQNKQLMARTRFKRRGLKVLLTARQRNTKSIRTSGDIIVDDKSQLWEKIKEESMLD